MSSFPDTDRSAVFTYRSNFSVEFTNEYTLDVTRTDLSSGESWTVSSAAAVSLAPSAKPAHGLSTLKQLFMVFDGYVAMIKHKLEDIQAEEIERVKAHIPEAWYLNTPGYNPDFLDARMKYCRKLELKEVFQDPEEKHIRDRHLKQAASDGVITLGNFYDVYYEILHIEDGGLHRCEHKLKPDRTTAQKLAAAYLLYQPLKFNMISDNHLKRRADAITMASAVWGY